MSKRDTDRLIAAMVKDLSPSNSLLSTPLVAWGWLVLSAAYVVMVVLLFGPLRPEASHQLMNVPHFSLEVLFGIAAVVLLGHGALRSMVPGVSTKRTLFLGWSCALVWLLAIGFGFWVPVLEPSMSGKRDHCLWEALVASAPALMLGIAIARRRWVLYPIKTMLPLAAAAGMMPAIAMQLACMHEASHGLVFHVGPAITLLFAAVLLSGWLQKAPRPIT